MSSLYTVRPSEIRALSPTARKQLAAWDARVRALPPPGDKPSAPTEQRDLFTDVAPARERRPLPMVFTLPDVAALALERADGYRAQGNMMQLGRALETATDHIAKMHERDGWEPARPEGTIVRWAGGEAHIRGDQDVAAVMRKLAGPVSRSARKAKQEKPTEPATRSYRVQRRTGGHRWTLPVMTWRPTAERGC